MGIGLIDIIIFASVEVLTPDLAFDETGSFEMIMLASLELLDE
jgi:hypothetical protein